MPNQKTTSTKKSTVKKTPKSTSTKVTTVNATPTARKERFSFARASTLPALIAEFVGTFLLAAALLAGQGSQTVALFTLAAIVFTIGMLSGAHVNPAITIGAWITRKITGLRALFYVFAQLLGAMMALVVLSAYVSAAPEVDPQQAMFGGATGAQLFSVAALTEGREWYVFFAEVLGAAILAFVFASVIMFKDITRSALAIGFGYFLALVVAGFAASVVEATTIINPALALSYEAFAFSDRMTLVVYALGPIVGATAGFGLYSLISSQAILGKR